jgi:hypothetical protein
MKINWKILKEQTIDVIYFIIYFVITIVILSSLGVWLPFASDKAQLDSISCKTWHSLPWNLITYAVAIVMVSIIDRLRYLFKVTNKFKRNEREFLFLIIILLIGGVLIYHALVDSRFERLNDAILFSSSFTLLAWLVWVYVKLRNPSYDNFSTLGGEMQ